MAGLLAERTEREQAAELGRVWEDLMAEELGVQLAQLSLEMLAEELTKEWEVLMIGWLAAFALREKEHFCENRVSGKEK